jgi:hypothetical protein
MATLTVTDISRSGVDIAGVAAAAGGDQFANTGAEFLLVANAGGAPITVTLATAETVDGLAVADRTVAVSNGVGKVIGPFLRHAYSDANGMVQITYSDVTSVGVKVLRLTPAGA